MIFVRNVCKKIKHIQMIPKSAFLRLNVNLNQDNLLMNKKLRSLKKQTDNRCSLLFFSNKK
jgi:hypothetical protein